MHMLDFIKKQPITTTIIIFLLLFVAVLVLIITLINRKGNKFINKGEIHGNIDNSFVDNSLNITQVNTFVMTEVIPNDVHGKKGLPWPIRLANWITEKPSQLIDDLFNMKDDGTTPGALMNILFIFLVLVATLVLFLYTPPFLLILILILGVILLVQYLYLQLRNNLRISLKLLVNLAILLISAVLPFINKHQYAISYWEHTKLDISSIQSIVNTFIVNFDYFYNQLLNINQPEAAPVLFGIVLSVSTFLYLVVILYKMGQTNEVKVRNIILTSIVTVILNFLLQNIDLVYSIISHYQQKCLALGLVKTH
ncbi:hypothetical protein EAI73_08150 [Leuconostoc lactis]|nr:hypothetical protein EAI73_08150 [Leuconostoc lactis]